MTWSEAFKKFLEVIDNHLGRYSNASYMLKNAQAEGDAKRLLAQADRDAEDIKRGNLTVLDASKLKMTEVIKLGPDVKPEELTKEQRVIARLAHEEAKKDNNIQKVIAYAAEEILENPSDEITDVDEDLIARIFDEIKYVNKEDLQKVWAGLLAKSILRPEAVSVDLLDFLRRVDNKKAEEIALVGTYIINNLILSDLTSLQDLGFWLEMQSSGLITGVAGQQISKEFRSTLQDRYQNGLTYHNKCITLNHEESNTIVRVNSVYVLTKLGQQVFSLGVFSPSYEYLQEVAKKIKKDNPQVKVCLSDYTIISEDGVVSIQNEDEIIL